MTKSFIEYFMGYLKAIDLGGVYYYSPESYELYVSPLDGSNYLSPDSTEEVMDEFHPVEVPQGMLDKVNANVTQISDTADIAHSGTTGWGEVRIQFDFWGEVLGEVVDAARLIRSTFEGKSITIHSEASACFARVESEFDDFDSKEKIYRRSLDLMIKYNINQT